MGKTASLANIGTIADSSLGFRNRIINGAMVISQRGTSFVSPTDAYTIDRWEMREDTDGAVTVTQETDAPTGFGFSQKFLVTTADASLSATQRLFVSQQIEGFNTADLSFGSASASTVTLSFWVKSSLTGAFGGSLQNSARDRSYPFSYTISSANTWEQKTVTIAGDTTGTWIGATNGVGLRVNFGLGVGSDNSGTANAWTGSSKYSVTGAVSVIGTLNATWQVTGVQLEKGSTATSFDYRPYGTELALCQRYLPAFVSSNTASTLPFSGCGVNSTTQSGVFKFDVQARIPPTGVTVSSASHFTSSRPSTGNTVVTAVNFAASSTEACQIEIKAASGLVADVPYLLFANSASGVMLFTGCEL